MSNIKRRDDGTITYGPNDERRCTAMEYRLMNPRNRDKRYYQDVTCSLAKHGPEVEHEWMGRKFGTLGVPSRPKRYYRCAATEERESFRESDRTWHTKTVQCTLTHQHEQQQHEYQSIPFGTDMRKRAAERRAAQAKHRNDRKREVREVEKILRDVERGATARAAFEAQHPAVFAHA